MKSTVTGCDRRLDWRSAGGSQRARTISNDVAGRMLMTLTFLNKQLRAYHPDMQRRGDCCDPVAGLAAERRRNLGRPTSGHRVVPIRPASRDEHNHADQDSYEEGPDHNLATRDAGESSRPTELSKERSRGSSIDLAVVTAIEGSRHGQGQGHGRQSQSGC
jgi:hypothetical protein